jgi:hypothetical protein
MQMLFSLGSKFELETEIHNLITYAQIVVAQSRHTALHLYAYPPTYLPIHLPSNPATQLLNTALPERAATIRKAMQQPTSEARKCVTRSDTMR